MGGSPPGYSEIFSALSMLVYSLFSWVFALRLLNLVRGTWSIPEASAAIGYLFIAGIGYPLVAVGIGAWQSLGDATAMSLQIGGIVLLRIGLAGIFVFTWQTFRAEARWARAYTVLAALMLAAITANDIAEIASAASYEAAVALAGTGTAAVLSVALGALTFVWPAAESLRYYAKLRRRQVLGLANPVVVNRFLLWGIACTSSVIIAGVNVAATLAGQNILEYQPAMILSATIGIVNTVLLTLAFIPPASYLRVVRRRAEAHG
jgi:hypothetical protein